MCSLAKGDLMKVGEVSDLCCLPGYVSLLDATSSKQLAVVCNQTDEGAIAITMHNTKPTCARGNLTAMLFISAH